jgi:hypothetical protein
MKRCAQNNIQGRQRHVWSKIEWCYGVLYIFVIHMIVEIIILGLDTTSPRQKLHVTYYYALPGIMVVVPVPGTSLKL